MTRATPARSARVLAQRRSDLCLASALVRRQAMGSAGRLACEVASRHDRLRAWLPRPTPALWIGVLAALGLGWTLARRPAATEVGAPPRRRRPRDMLGWAWGVWRVWRAWRSRPARVLRRAWRWGESSRAVSPR